MIIDLNGFDWHVFAACKARGADLRVHFKVNQMFWISEMNRIRVSRGLGRS